MHLITLQLTLPLPPPPTPPNIVCVLINFMYWLVGRVLGGMVSANVKKKNRGQNKFLAALKYFVLCLMIFFFKVENSNLDTRSYISRYDQKLLERIPSIIIKMQEGNLFKGCRQSVLSVTDEFC